MATHAILFDAMSANEHAAEARAAYSELLAVYALVLGLGDKVVGSERIDLVRARYDAGNEHYERSGLYKVWLYSLARAAGDADLELAWARKGI